MNRAVAAPAALFATHGSLAREAAPTSLRFLWLSTWEAFVLGYLGSIAWMQSHDHIVGVLVAVDRWIALADRQVGVGGPQITGFMINLDHA